jgi:hypothetical protein
MENSESVEICEEMDGDKKNHFITGVFLQAEVENRNHRIYPKQTLFNEVKRYKEVYIDNSRSVGELGHPDSPKLTEDRISHLVTALEFRGNDVIGRAKLLDTPMGKIAKTLIDEGVKFGVSSRGLGSLKDKNGINVVQPDFRIKAIDIVHDPSAPSAFVNGIMEGREWFDDDADNELIEEIKRSIHSTTRAKLEEAKVQAFQTLMNKLSG